MIHLIRHKFILCALVALLTGAAFKLDAAASHLPLTKGNKWTLRASFGDTLSYEVVGTIYSSYRVKWNNPWVAGMEYRFEAVGNKVMATSMDVGSGAFDLPSGTKFFDFDAPLQNSWSNVMGTFTVTGRNLTVTTPVRQFTNCTRISQRSPEGVVFEWTLAPGVGFIQFGSGAAAYQLSTSPVVFTESKTAAAPPAAPLAKGSRFLGIDANPAQSNDYVATINLAKAAGAQGVSMTVFWEQIESSATQRDATLFETANQFYPAYGLALDLSLTAMDTVGKHVPADLYGLPMNHAVVIDRYKRYIDFAFSQMPSVKLNYILIGAEVDLGLKSAAEWTQFEGFVAAVAPYIRSKRPGVKVGVSSTYAGLMGPNQAALKRMSRDAIFVSYYPMNAYHEVRDPSVVSADFDALAQEFIGYPLIFEQIGYPSSAATGSSAAKQSAFIKAVFAAWDKHATRIPAMNLSWLTDLSPADIATYKSYYGITDTRFLEMLRTLGFRTWSGTGTNKSAYSTLISEAKARGW